MSLDLPPGLVVSCTSDADCPDDATCNPLTGQCDFNVGNSAPAAAFRLIGPANGRAATRVVLTVDAIDTNAPPVGRDVVTFSLAYALDGSTWCDATLDGVPDAVGATTTSLTIVWDALADAQRSSPGGPCSLATTQIVAAPQDGAATTTVLAFVDDVRLRLTAVDSGTPAARSEVISPAFAIGNDPPVLELLDDGATLRQASPFEYTLADSSLDEARIEVQFRVEGTTPSDWYTASVRGSTVGVVADAPGGTINRLLVWNADAPLPLDTTTPGGIGSVNRAVTLRVRAVESALGEMATYGAWATLSADVQNQTAPVVGGVEVVPIEPEFASTLVYVSYEVVDAESDPVDIALDYSLDGGATFRPATPYPAVQHSGTRDVSSRDSAPDRHTFVWNVGADISNPSDNVRVRVIAADDGGQSAPAFGTVPVAVGSAGSAAITDFVYPVFSTSAHLQSDTSSREGTLVATGDVTGDGRDDCVVWAGGPLEFYPGLASGGLGSRTTYGSSSFRTRALTIVDVNHDGRGDVIARTQEDGMFVGIGGPSGPTYTTVAIPTTLMAFMATGDFNGDTHTDIAINANQGFQVLLGTGTGTFAAPISVPVGNYLYSMAAGDFDGDGLADLAYAVATGSGFGQTVKPTFVEVRVRFGSSTGSPPFRAGYEAVASGLGLDSDGAAYKNVQLAAYDVRGDNRDELAFVDLQQLNLSRLRLLSRDGTTWRTVDAFADALPPMDRLRFRSGPPLHVVLGNETTAVAVLWDPAVDRWARFTADTAGANDLVAGDRNGDGKADLVVVTKTAITVRLRGDERGAPVFSGNPSRTFIVPDENQATVAADFDGDGLVDVWAMDARYNSNHVIARFRGASLRNVPQADLMTVDTPTFMVPNSTILGGASDHPAVGDVNGDGAPDVVLSTDTTNYYLTLGNGVPSAFSSATLVASAEGGGPMVLGDIDADGRDDAVNVQGFVGVHYARGPAGTVTSWLAAPTATPDVVTVGDLDGDGVDDVAGADSSNDAVRVYFGGAGGMSAPCSVTVPGAGSVSAMAIGDVAGRGANALVVSTPTNIYVWTVGRCSYSGLTTSNASVGLRDMELVDVDGDGVLDIVAGGVGVGFSNRYVAAGLVSGGKPTGGFGPLTLVRGGVESLTFGDINADGIADMLAATTDDQLKVFVNHRYAPGPAWSQVLAASDVLGAPRATDRFGRPWTLEVLARPVVDRDLRARAARDFRSSFATRLRRSGLTVAATATAISLAWQFAGDLASDSTISGTDTIVTVHPSVGGSTMIVSLPLYDAAPTDAAKMRVYGRVTTEYETEANGALSRTADGRSLWTPVENWVEVALDPDGDLATGTGPRFVYDGPNKRIRIATDALGVFRAYAVP